jgi:hypothetical protein
MPGAGSLFLLSAGVFFLYAFIVRQEVVKGRRLLLSGFRDQIDVWLERGYSMVRERTGRLYRLTIKLSWYYSIHSALRTLLSLLVKMYDRIEEVFISNRERAKVLRAEKKQLRERNHLEAMIDHKEAVALTPKEKKKLRDKRLLKG